MGAAGRNEQCECGSGRKAKRCCGVQRGPSEADLARAFLAGQVRPAARVLRGCSDDELYDLEAEMLELPTIDASLQLPLPRLLTPDVDRPLVIEEDELDEIDDALPVVLELRDRQRIDPRVAAGALIELAAPKR